MPEPTNPVQARSTHSTAIDTSPGSPMYEAMRGAHNKAMAERDRYRDALNHIHGLVGPGIETWPLNTPHGRLLAKVLVTASHALQTATTGDTNG